MDAETNLLDIHFANAICKEPHAIAFAASLMKHSRMGHLCLCDDKGIDLPAAVCEEGKTLFPSTPIVRDANRYYLQKNWVYETYILQQIHRLHRAVPMEGVSQHAFCEALEKEDKLLAGQKEAIRHVFTHPFTIICGGPGTGKTYTAAHLVRLILASTVLPRYRIVVAAPTGKAANHLHSTLQGLLDQGEGAIGADLQSYTLHRLLRLQPGETKLFSPKRIDADLVLVDEASMIDVPLFAHLLESIGGQTRLVLMGDPDQLPPVEAGSLFTECAGLFGVRLSRCMRSETAALHQAAEAIQRGEDFFDIAPVQEIKENWVDLLYDKIAPIISDERPDPAASLRHYQKCRILNALRQGPFGGEALNRGLLEKMDRHCKPGQWWSVPIMVRANLPRLDLYNGSSGVLIGQKGSALNPFTGLAYFSEKGAAPLAKLPPFEISCCLSIHKAQGSEFDHVVTLFPQGSENFGKEALYTAATRAKKGWEILGEEKILREMLKKPSRRMSGFTERFTNFSIY